MRLYVSCHDSVLARQVAAELEAAGHEITSVWHGDTQSGPRAAVDDDTYWTRRAEDNFTRIAVQSNGLVLVSGPGRYPGGKYVEATIAHCSLLPVYVIGAVENGMLWGLKPQVFPDTTAFILWEVNCRGVRDGRREVNRG